ncbi:MAG TPA: alpha/beta hydrolase [Streptosporangiaceae bacterium]|jgi:pimeloyl-ACP methyl ester carboxylesterase
MSPPLAIADQGFFFAGLREVALPHGTAVTGMHVQYQIPAEVRQPYPLVMVHGGGGQALDFLGTPDGRSGWATLFLREGYAVYVVDRPGMGRSPYHPDLLGPASPAPVYEGMITGFAAPATRPWPYPYPQARLHTQWPGTGEPGDPALAQFLAGSEPMAGDLVSIQEAMRDAGAALLDRTGPAVLLTHSIGGAFGWLVADARPDLVKAIVAVEPIGPAFTELPGMGALSWGLTSIPITYDPPVTDPAELRREQRAASGPDLMDALVQAEPAHRLANLAGGLPVAVVTGEASWHAQFDWAIVEFLRQAGVDADHIVLADLGIHGNGHLMPLERNNAEVASAIAHWLAKR